MTRSTDTDRDGAIDKRETFIAGAGSHAARVLSTVELDIDYGLCDVTGRRTSGTVRLNSFEARRDSASAT